MKLMIWAYGYYEQTVPWQFGKAHKDSLVKQPIVTWKLKLYVKRP